MKHTRQMYRTYSIVTLAVFVAACVAVESIAIGPLSVPAMPFSAVFLGAALCLLLYTAASAIVYFRMLGKKPVAVVRYYMAHTMARFVFGGIVLWVCHSIAGQSAKPALVGFGVLFLALLVSESIVYIQIEKNLDENKSNI